MKKGKVLLLTICLSLLFVLTGCTASMQNSIAKNGGIISSTGDYIIINTSGNVILDIWKLKDTYVDSSANSDGWSFIDNNGNSVMLSGDAKIMRVKDSETWDKYQEYHYDEIFVQYLKEGKDIQLMQLLSLGEVSEKLSIDIKEDNIEVVKE